MIYTPYLACSGWVRHTYVSKVPQSRLPSKVFAQPGFALSAHLPGQAERSLLRCERVCLVTLAGSQLLSSPILRHVSDFSDIQC